MADRRTDSAPTAIEIALGEYPDPRFRERLRQRLLMRIRMAARTTIVPYVMVQDVEPTISFVKAVFGAEEVQRAVGSAGGIHCELRIGDATLMFGGATPTTPVKPRILGFHIYVDDVDAVYQRALDAGATSLGEPTNRPYGERAGFVRDAAGNLWHIATRTGPGYFTSEVRTVVPHLYFRQTPLRDASGFITFLERAFGAELEMRHEEAGHVVHAVMRIGGDALELGEGEARHFDAPAAIVLNVEDCDAAYQRAIDAGATSLLAPASQSFGGRMAAVTDAWDNEWFIASS